MSETESPTTEPYVTPPSPEHLTPEGTIKPEKYLPEKDKPQQKTDIEVDEKMYRPRQKPPEQYLTQEGKIKPKVYAGVTQEQIAENMKPQKRKEQFDADVKEIFNTEPVVAEPHEQPKQSLRQKVANFFKGKVKASA